MGLGRPEGEGNPGFVPQRAYPSPLVAQSIPGGRAERVVFAHYDGYDVRVVEARRVEGTWSLNFKKTALHEERDDLSFPFTESDVREARERGDTADGGP
jgi:hypothetical protein